MSLSKARQLREQRAKLVADAQALIPAEGQPLTPENRGNFKKMMDDADALKGDIDLIERSEAQENELRTTQKPPEARIDVNVNNPAAPDRAASVSEYRTALRKHGVAGIEKLRPETRTVVESLNESYWDACKDYLRHDLQGMAPEKREIFLGLKPEYRDMGVGTNTLGGYFVPQGFVYEIEEALKFYGGMLEASRRLPTATGQPLPFPTSNDTGTVGELIGEGVQVNTGDVTIGHILLGAYKYSTKMVKVSLELLQDSAFDLESYLKGEFALRLGRILNTHFTTGTGSSQPNGLVTAAIAQNGSPQAWAAGSGPGIPVIAAGSAANTGGAETGATSIGSADFVNIEHSVDRLYRQGAQYMMHDLTLRSAKTILDKYGRPLWTPGMANNAPDMINGYSYVINNDMAPIAASAVSVLFGKLNKYLIRDVRELAILRLNERFADYGQVAFIGFARKDGNLIDAGTHPVNYLIQHS